MTNQEEIASILYKAARPMTRKEILLSTKIPGPSVSTAIFCLTNFGDIEYSKVKGKSCREYSLTPRGIKTLQDGRTRANASPVVEKKKKLTVKSTHTGKQYSMTETEFFFKLTRQRKQSYLSYF